MTKDYELFIKTHLQYDETSPTWLRWKSHPSPRHQAKVGQPAGCPESKGYHQISVWGKIMKAHQVVWFLNKGYWAKEIDHRDRNRANSQIDNLRDATRSQNQLNKGGVKGYRQQYGRWTAYLSIDGKQTHLGSFSTEEEAKKAREDAYELHYSNTEEA